MEQLIIKQLPISKEKFTKIIDLLLDKKPIIPSIEYENETEIYNILDYHNDLNFHNIKSWLVLDRNLVTRLIWLYKGNEVRNENDNYAAAIIAFAQLSGIEIDFYGALQEAAKNNIEANNELLHFRNANEVEPEYWANIALDITKCISEEILSEKIHTDKLDINFLETSLRWKLYYVLVLKIAELELEGGSSILRIEKFLQWMYDESALSGPALILAINYLAPNSQRKGLLKNLRSINRDKALNGIKNATWDLTYLSEFIAKIKKQDDNNQRWLFASLDDKLRDFARTLIAHRQDDNPFERMVIDKFGEIKGKKILEKLAEYESKRNSTHRLKYKPDRDALVDRMIKEGENKIMEWKV